MHQGIRLYTDIVTSQWMIDPMAAQRLMPMLQSILKGDASVIAQAAGINTTAGRKDNFYYMDQAGNLKWGQQVEDIPAGSIAVFNLEGVMMASSDYCTEGTLSMAARVENAAQNKNIIGALVIANSPGGQTSGCEQLGNALKKFGKPTATFVQGCAASACVWVISATDKIFLSSKTDYVGSIGTIGTVVDDSGFYEMNGIKITEIYATKSTHKNIEWRKALEGDFKPMLATYLDPVNEIFHSAVKAGRGEKLDLSPETGVLAGAMFIAKDAIKVGLADAMGTMADAINFIKASADKRFYVNV